MQLISSFCAGLPNTKELPNALACHQLVEKVTPASWRGTLDNMSMEELCDLHDKSYTRQAVLDYHLNTHARDLIHTMKGTQEKMDDTLAKEKKRDQEYAELKAKCEEAMEELDKNPLVQDLRTEIKDLEKKVKVA